MPAKRYYRGADIPMRVIRRYAQQIAEQAGKLYDKFVAFTEDLAKIGANLKAAKDSYDKAENKLKSGNGNLIGRADNLRCLGVKTTKKLANTWLAIANESDLGGGANLEEPQTALAQ